MRLHRLEVQAFLAFPGREHVDFDALGDAGLFLLTGRTGAGKTALLDAITYALYGQVAGTRPVRGLRSEHAAPGVPTEVVLEVTLRDRRLRIVRRPEQVRPVRRGTGTTVAKAEIELSRTEADGSHTVITTRLDEAGHELGELLGMTKAQFCQVVLLPQGQFQEFLHAKTDDRRRLLADLFDVTRFEDVEAWLKAERDRAARAAESGLRELRDLVSRACQEVDPGGEAGPPEGWEADPDLAAGWVDEQAVVAAAQDVTAADVLERATAARRSAEAALDAAQRLAALQTEHDAARAELAAVEATRARRDATASELERARAAAPAAAHVAAWRERAAAAATAQTAAEGAVRVARRAGIAGPDGAGAGDFAALADSSRRQAGQVEAAARLETAVAEEARAIAALRRRATALAEEAAGHAARRDALDAMRPGAVAAAQAARDARAAEPGLRAAAERARERARAAHRRDGLASELAAAETACLAAREDALAAAEARVGLETRRLEGFAAELAADLADGEPCRVCGSTEHPLPAPAPEGGLVDEPALAAARSAEAQAAQARDRAQERVAAARAEHASASAAAGDEAADELDRAAQEAVVAHERALALSAGCEAAQRTVAQLDAQREELTEALRAAEIEHGTLTAQADSRARAHADDESTVAAARAGAASVTERVAQLGGAAEAADAAADALAAAQRARDEHDRARATATQEAAAAGFPDVAALDAAVRDEAACGRLESALEAWGTALAERRAAAMRPDLVDAAVEPRPDLDALAAAVRLAKPAEGAAQDARSAAQRRHVELRRLGERLRAAVVACGPLLERRAVVAELADLAAGRSASNRLRISLSAYVLAARLEEVAAAASVRLATMTDGRYTLEHTDAGATGRSRGGLDLVVVDAWTGGRRPPGSLSGGETFMASLALALGLADTVTARSGGLRLDTLFIDEGFGTLDDEGTLDAVMEALDALREGGRTVGLVSHVAELRQRIPAQVRVVKGRDGSTVAPVRVAVG